MFTDEKLNSHSLGTVHHGIARRDRKFQILSHLYEARYTNPYRREGAPYHFPACWRTSYEIARALGMTPSQHLRHMLYELYQEGMVLQSTAPHRGNQFKFVFVIADNARWSTEYRAQFDSYLEDAPGDDDDDDDDGGNETEAITSFSVGRKRGASYAAWRK
jgi:hypothetical protein